MIQDLIVSPEYQQKGIGTYLFKTIKDKYKDVRMFIVLTDIEDVVDNKFYQSFKLRRLDEFNIVGYMR